jgi:hypothetical protein
MATVDTTIEQLDEITAYTGLADGDSIPIYDTSETSAEPTKRVELDTLTSYMQNNLSFGSDLTAVSKTSNYSVLEGDSGKMFYTSTNGVEYNLPSLASLSSDVVYGFTNINAGIIYIEADGSDGIRSDSPSGTQLGLGKWETALLYTTASHWVAVTSRNRWYRQTVISADLDLSAATPPAALFQVFPDGVIYANHTTGTVTVTLPNTFAYADRITVAYMNTGGTLTIDTPGSYTIEGSASISTTVKYSSVTLVPNQGSIWDWYVIAQTGTWT